MWEYFFLHARGKGLNKSFRCETLKQICFLQLPPAKPAQVQIQNYLIGDFYLQNTLFLRSFTS